MKNIKNILSKIITQYPDSSPIEITTIKNTLIQENISQEVANIIGDIISQSESIESARNNQIKEHENEILKTRITGLNNKIYSKNL